MKTKKKLAAHPEEAEALNQQPRKLTDEELAQVTGGGKPKYERDKPHVNIGTIGHVDHGKITLIGGKP